MLSSISPQVGSPVVIKGTYVNGCIRIYHPIPSKKAGAVRDGREGKNALESMVQP
jgi:hypothetical protein